MKIDPLAVRYEARPGTGAILTEIPEKKWKDGLWLARRKRLSFEERPRQYLRSSCWLLEEKS